MSTEFDSQEETAPETEEFETDSLEGLKAAESDSAEVDDNDDGSIAEVLEIPMLELDEEEYTGNINPAQDDEFTCGNCFLIQDKSLIGRVESDGTILCQDCA